MRILIRFALLAAVAAAVPAAAQPGERADAAPSIQPLPSVLVPGGAGSGEQAAVAPDAIDRGMITGALVGMTTGVAFAVFVADKCGVESDCTLSPEYKTLIYGIIGTTLGAMIGIGTTFVLGGRTGDPNAGLAAPPDAGGLRIGVTLRP